MTDAKPPVPDATTPITITSTEASGPVFSVDEIVTGCKVYVFKENGKRLAEILQSHVKKGQKRFYVHYQDYNKRLDEWIAADRIDYMVPLVVAEEEPEEKNPSKSKSKSKSKSQKKGKANDSRSTTAGTGNGDELDLDNLNVQGLKRPGEEESREDEIKKLRTSGSMIQNHSEVARVRNLSTIILGNIFIEP
ncbi:hypothetical protein JCM33374_g3412, partial [Metschnikowia sp. JCM 33374]